MQMTMTCAEESRAVSETLAGTFKPADTFFLIESSLPDYGGWNGEAVKSAATGGPFAPITWRTCSPSPRDQGPLYPPAAIASEERLHRPHQPENGRKRLPHRARRLSLTCFNSTSAAWPRTRRRASTSARWTRSTSSTPSAPMAATTPAARRMARRFITSWSHSAGERARLADDAYRRPSPGGHPDRFPARHRLRPCRSARCRSHHQQPARRLSADAQISRTRRLRRARPGCRRASSGRRRRSRHPRARAPIPPGRLSVCMRCSDRWTPGASASPSWTQTAALHCAEVTSGWSAPRLTSCGDAPKPMPQHEVVVLAAD